MLSHEYQSLSRERLTNMADKKMPLPRRRDSNKSGSSSKPSSPSLGNRKTSQNQEENETVPSTSSNCSSPLLPRQKGRFSFYSHSSENSERRSVSRDGNKPRKAGFLKIFRWFRKQSRSREDVDGATGSAISLESSSQEPSFFPLSRSKSADSSRCKNKIQEYDNCGSSFVKVSESTPSSPRPRDNCMVNCTSITDSETSSIASPSTIQKKRTAPRPPESNDYYEVVLRKEVDTSNITVNRDSIGDRTNPFFSSKRSSLDSTNSVDETNCKSNSDFAKYARNKRKAPQPPLNECSIEHSSVSKVSENGSLLNRSLVSISAQRPISSLSSIDAISSSQFSTLKSSSSTQSSSTLRGSISSKCSTESFRIEKGFLKQDLQNQESCVTSKDLSKNSPNPRPWYKRKKKNKLSKKQEKVDAIDQVYEFWRPEIQFNEGKISLNKNSLNTFPPKLESSSSKKLFDVNKSKRRSQVSLLASISQLDQEAVEQIRQEKEEIKAAKEAYNDKFYKKTAPHQLTQMDVLGQSPSSSPKLFQSCNKTEGSNQYDNVENGQEPRFNYTKQVTLKLQNDTDVKKKESEVLKSTAIGLSSSENIKSRPNGHNSPSLLQMANLDAEMFYQLAKDVKNSPDVKLKSNLPKTSKICNNTNCNDEEPCSKSHNMNQHRQTKNFGIRMNHLFTPDVSVIMETTESVASSATTPAEDGLSDITMSEMKNITDVHQQENAPPRDIDCGYRYNSDDTREIIKELADVREEIDRINEEENEDRRIKNINKADKMMQEVRTVREKNQFTAWGNMVTTSSPESPVPGTPPPIEIVTPKPESKLKWICETCTLINLPRRITCEACSSRRPTNPSRVRNDGTVITPPKDPDDEDESQMNLDINGSPLTIIERKGNIQNEQREDEGDIYDRCHDNDSLCPTDSASQILQSRKRTNWESELKRYFTASNQNGFDSTVSSGQNSHILFNNIRKESVYGKINIVGRERHGNISETLTDQEHTLNNIVSENPDIEQLRKARVEKFEEGIKSFEAMITGSSEKYTSSSYPDSRDVHDRPIAKQIDSLIPQFNSSEKVFYKKEVRKHPALNTRGAVKNTISIFNQKEQVSDSKERKIGPNKQVRRKSIGLIKDQTNLFENMQAITSKADSRTKNANKEIHSEINISSAISKFDEIAAIAEVERLNPLLNRGHFSKKPKKLVIDERDNTKDQNGVVMRYNPTNGNETDMPSHTTMAYNSQLLSPPTIDNNFEPEPRILDGILYTANEGRNRALSIGSSSFELIHAREFEEFENEQSQRTSPTSEYEDFFLPPNEQDDSDNVENFVDAASDQNYINGSSLPIIFSEIINASNENEIVNEKIRVHENDVAISEDDFLSTYQDEEAISFSVELEEVERLSHELTLTRGIDTFKGKCVFGILRTYVYSCFELCFVRNIY